MKASIAPLRLSIVIFGLSITSSWGNGHATTYRGLVRELVRRGHDVTFLERETPWYAANRDLPNPPYGRTFLYHSLGGLRRRFGGLVRQADLVIVGSFVPEGIELGEWVTRETRGLSAFYDIDTPVTLAKLARDTAEYLTPALVARYGLYLSFTGGPVLELLERRYGARAARPLYCSVDPDLYAPAAHPVRWDLGYMGTYSRDRQPKLDMLLCAPARAWPEGRFVVVGPQYPSGIAWPENCRRVDHLSPRQHRRFYTGQRFTLNITRNDMVRAGWSPSVRLFEAAACATTVISDTWPGLEAFFVPGKEILLARSAGECLAYLRELPDDERRRIGRRARERVLARHTAAHRAAELEAYVLEAMGRRGSAEAWRPAVTRRGGPRVTPTDQAPIVSPAT
jgi:spore maturation protein CgeB